MPPRLLLASTNHAKQARISWLVEGLDLYLVTPRELGALHPVEENGPTHAANAAKKALEWSRQAGCLALATDGGLVIPGLGERWSPLTTARFAGPHASDNDRIHALLALMDGLAGTQRVAWFQEAAALADCGRLVKEWEVESPRGVIATAHDPAREAGAWAFSLWTPDQFGRTYAALSPSERTQLDDHWGRLRHLIQSYFRQGNYPLTI